MKKPVVIIIAAVVALALIGAGVFFAVSGVNAPKPTPTPTETYSNVDIANDAAGEKTIADRLYSKAPATTSYSKEQVALALVTANNYTSTAITDSNIASGNWAAKGLSLDYFNSTLARFLAPEMIAPLTEAITISQVNDPNLPETKIASDTLVRSFNLVYLGDKYTLTNGCTDVEASPCFTTEPVFSDFTVGENANGELVVSQKVDFAETFAVKTGGTITITRSYEFNLTLVLNKDKFEDSDPTYVIKAMDNGVKSTASFAK